MISNTYRVFPFLALAFVVGVGVLASPSQVEAQGDWDVKRDPFDRSLIRRYKSMLRKNPNNKSALGKLTRMYKRYRSVKLLVSEFEKELGKKPKSFSLLLVLGHLETGRGNSEIGLGYYKRAAAERPSDAGVQIALGDLFKTASKNKEAKAAYEKALTTVKAKKLKIRVLRALADIALDTGDINSAIKHYEAYFKLDPKNVQAQIDFGDALARYERYTEAIAAFRAAEKRLKTDPTLRIQVISRIGRAYERNAKPDLAVKEYKRGIGLVGRGYFQRRELTERIVVIYREGEKLNVLLGEFEREWKASKRGHFEWDILGRLYEETGNQDKALVAYRAATAKSPYELETQRRLINLLETTGRDKEALAQYEKVIRVAPGEPRFQLELAKRYKTMGNDKRAFAMLKKINASFSRNPGVIASLAELYGAWGKPDLALAAYQKLTKIEPNDSRHLINLGNQYYQRKQQKKALAIWRKIARRGDAESHALLAQVYAENNLATLALESFSKAISLDAKKPRYYQGRARVYDGRRRYPQAIADWEKSLALTPDREANQPARREARRQIVNLLARTSDRTLTSRINKWSRAFAAKPPDIGAGYFLVEAHLRRNKPERAQTVLEKLLVANPKDTVAMHQLVKVYRARRDYDKAVDLLKRLLALNPGRGHDYYTQIAEIMTAQRRDDDAIYYSQKALEKSPNDPNAHLELAKRYVEMTRYEEAIAAYEKTLKHAPNNTKAYFALANLYGFKNERGKEAKLYLALLDRSKDDEVLLRAGRAAINLAENVGKLGALERPLSRMTFDHAHKRVYRHVLVELYGRYVPLLVYRRSFGKKKQQTAAAAELKRLGTHGLKPLLDALSDDKNSQQQRTAVAVLGFMGNKAAAPPLVRLATEKEPAPTRVGTLMGRSLDWNVRVDALVAAGRLADSRVLPDLLKLRQHREVAMREAAIFALGMTGDPRAAGPLGEALTDRRDSVRTLACLGFARISANKSADAVITAFTSSKNSDLTRAACAYAAGSLGARSAVPALAASLADGNDHAQRLAAYALGRLADRRAIEALIGAYFSKRGAVRDTVAWALARTVANKPDRSPVLAEFEYVPRYGKFDQSQAIESLAVRLEAVPLNAAQLVAHESALIAGIISALNRHRDLQVRILTDLDSRPRAVGLGILTRGVEERSATEQKRIEAVIKRIGAAVATSVVKLTRHADLEVRRRALSVTAKLGDKSKRSVLEAALDDSSVAVVSAAAKAAQTYYAVTADAAIAQSLNKLLAGSPSWEKRLASCRALHTLHRVAPAGAALARALGEDKNAIVRACAASGVGAVGANHAEAALIGQSSSSAEPRPEVRIAVARALAALGTSSATSAATKMASSDPDALVRRAAESAVKIGPPRKK